MVYIMKVNDSFRLMPPSYLFSEVAARISAFRNAHPECEIIRMDIGDVTRPLPKAAVEAMHMAVEELASSTTFHGYGPEQGHLFLREAIAEHDYRQHGIDIEADDIFISDGAKSDIGNFGDLFTPQTRIALTDPCYPVYVDANVIDGRQGVLADGRWSNIEYLDCTPDSGFLPSLPVSSPDVIYLCYPNNPTGSVMTRQQLQQWVDYALRHKVLIIFDSAYEAYISHPDIPRSIYEIENADTCAVEVRSFSKTAGFTGVRCGYTVVPRSLSVEFADGSSASLHRLWNRRQCTKFNGASYIVQRGAAALYTPEGKAQVRENIEYYMRNARYIRQSMTEAGWEVTGGEDSPYIWMHREGETDSWALFQHILETCGVSSTPGVGFGKCGTGCLRLTGFNTYENTVEAMRRISLLY